jgi:dTDP-4-dehydrorhamnose reductase
MRILVTGANGLVGSRLARALAARGHRIIAASRGESRLDASFEYFPVELSDESAVSSLVERTQPSVIINPASMTEVDRCQNEPLLAYAANVQAAANLAKAARQVGAHVLHVSTDYVFDGKAGPYSEEAIPNPRGAYAVSKHMGEQAVSMLAPSWAIARTAVVYGWPKAARMNFGAWLVDALRKKQPVRLFHDQFISPSLANNVAAMLAEMAERKLTGIWNIAGADVVDRMTFGRALCAQFGFSTELLTPISLEEAKLASPRPFHSGLLVTKAERTLSTKPLGLKEALSRFHQDFLQDPNI